MEDSWVSAKPGPQEMHLRPARHPPHEEGSPKVVEKWTRQPPPDEAEGARNEHARDLPRVLWQRLVEAYIDPGILRKAGGGPRILLVVPAGRILPVVLWSITFTVTSIATFMGS